MISSLKAAQHTHKLKRAAKHKVVDTNSTDEVAEHGDEVAEHGDDDSNTADDKRGCYKQHDRNCFTDFIVWRPVSFLFVTIAIPAILTGVSMQYFTLNDLNGWEVRFGDLTLAHNAFEYAMGLADEVERVKQTTQSSSRRLAVGDNILRLDASGGWLQVFYENQLVACGLPEDSQEQNILTPGGVRLMIEAEQEVLLSTEYVLQHAHTRACDHCLTCASRCQCVVYFCCDVAG